jgi:O-antigen/teichoic acid export membrane protein
MPRIRQAAKATLVAQCFNWTSLLLSLVTVPLYLSWLGEERYGLLLTGIALAGYLMFSDAGITWASMLLIAEANGRDDRAGIASIFRTSFPLAALSSLLVVVAVVLFALFVEKSAERSWIPYHPELAGLLLAIGASVVASLVFSPFYNLLMGLQETHIAAVYQGTGRLITILHTVLLAANGASLGWVYFGNVVGVVIAGIVAALHCRRRHPWAFQRGPFLESGQVRRQFRTGVSSLLMQSGTVFLATAPVMATSVGAGPQIVPYLAIPLTLLNAPLGILSNFSASLQAGYGEAMGRGESGWVAGTVSLILRQAFTMLSLLGCGWFLLASDFVDLWTQGRIELSPVMVGNAFLIAGSGVILTTLRFALTGINRHRRAAVGELIGGLLALAAGIVVVRHFGFAWIGLTMFAAVVLVTGWLFPVELKRALGGISIRPTARFWLSLGLTTMLSFGAGWAIKFAMTSPPVWLVIPITGTVVTVVFLLLAVRFLREEIAFATKMFSARLHPPLQPVGLIDETTRPS